VGVFGDAGGGGSENLPGMMKFGVGRRSILQIRQRRNTGVLHFVQDDGKTNDDKTGNGKTAFCFVDFRQILRTIVL
jgi:hypothetical protein